MKNYNHLHLVQCCILSLFFLSDEYESLKELNEYSPPPSEIELANELNVLSQAAEGNN